MPSYQKIFSISILAFLLLFYGLLIAQGIDLVTADLGRHLKNGELFFTERFFIPHTNLYSFTSPDYPFINHHWASSAIFYSVWRMAGFAGLSLFFILISAVSFLLFFDIARKESGFEVASVVALFAIPVIAARSEIRPEMFSYLFIGVFFWILWSVSQKRIRARWLFALPFFQLLWANLHIYFPFGLALIVLFAAPPVFRILFKKDAEAKKELAVLSQAFALAIAATLINPSGLRGALYPFRIFGNYGYLLFENQSVFFIERILHYPPALYFKILSFLFAVSVIAGIFFSIRRKISFHYIPFLLGLAASVMAWSAVRNFTLFGFIALFAIPLALAPVKISPPTFPRGIRGCGRIKLLLSRNSFFLAPLLLVLFIGLVVINPAYWNGRRPIGIGIDEKSQNSIRFFQTHNLKGPIFNNYDIGGYLIFSLFPKERVFVDNRPEAYPKGFFNDIYIPMQENTEIWSRKSAAYGFNAIFFYRNDITPWAQHFLIERVSDPKWAPVYVDNSVIIFLRRGGQNQNVIDAYELPKEMFGTKNPS